MALDGIGSLIENELKLLIEKCLADYAEKELEKSENSPWFTSYVRNATKTRHQNYVAGLHIFKGTSGLLKL